MLPDHVQTFIDAEIAASTTDFSDLRAVFVNGTLKRTPAPSHTDGLIAISRHILEAVGARVDTIRAVDHDIPPGVSPGHARAGVGRATLPGDLPRADRPGAHRGAGHARSGWATSPR